MMRMKIFTRNRNFAISPNQRWFVSGGSDGQIYVWQLAQNAY
jgi:WD40 repeat protein